MEVGDVFKNLATSTPIELSTEGIAVRFNVAGKQLTFLRHVYTTFKPGSLIAVMGSSGGGKTTLLNCLTQRAAYQEGSVMVNGAKVDSSFLKMSCYVQQDDLIWPYLTVREHLEYQAELRLPDMTSKERLDFVDTMLDLFQLRECAEIRIGGGEASGADKGIPLGEKKRLAIATELLTSPSVLFLDEPTSLLDSTMSVKVVKLLKSLAQGGRTVLCTIHQPTARVFNEFDELLLLSDGQVVYHGPRNQVVPYFDRLGYPLPAFTNPAEHVIKLFARLSTVPRHLPDGKGLDQSFDPEQRIFFLKNCWQHHFRKQMVASSTSTDQLNAMSVSELNVLSSYLKWLSNALTEYKAPSGNVIGKAELTWNGDADDNVKDLFPVEGEQFNIAGIIDFNPWRGCKTLPDRKELIDRQQAVTALVNERMKVIKDKKDETQSTAVCCSLKNTDASEGPKTRRTATFMEQLSVLVRRGMKMSLRDPQYVRMRVATAVMLSVFFGLVFLRVDNTQESVQSKNGALFFAMMASMMLAVLAVCQVLPTEKPLAIRDFGAGAYTPAAFFTSRWIVDFPAQNLVPLIFTPIFVYLVGLNDDATSFGFVLLFITLIANLGCSFGYLFSAVLPDLSSSLTVGPACIVPLALFSGFPIQDADIPVGWIWMRYFTPFRYCFRGLLISVYNNNYPAFEPCPPTAPFCYQNGEQVLQAQGVDPNDLGMFIAILAGMTVAFRLIAHILFCWKNSAISS